MTVQLGELQARLTAESSQLKQEVLAVKKGIAELGEQGARTSKSFDIMNAAVAKIASNTNHLKAIEQQLKKIDPAKMEQGFAAVVAELQKMGAERKQIETLEQALAEMSQQAQVADTRVGQLEEELKQLGDRRLDVDKVNEELKDTDTAAGNANHSIQGLAAGIAGLGAGVTLAKLISLIQTLSGEANQLANSYRGLNVVADKFNINTEQAADLADKLADRWGMNKGLLADTVKTYLTMNFTLDQTEKIITATADAAAYNRQAHLSWGEAIKQVADGIKSGNSDLTDAAGITTNLSVMQERYAKSIGTTAGKLTDAQKVQAAYNGMLQEGAIFAGNADDAMTGFTGTQASFQSTLQEARIELGETFLPAIERILELLTPLIAGFASWASENKELVAGITAGTLAITGLLAILTTAVTVIYALRTAAVALELSLGPIGWGIAAIGLVAGAFAAYTASSHKASEEAKKFADNQELVNRKLNESPISLKADEYKKMQENIKQLSDVLERRNKLEEEINQRMNMAQSGQGSIENTNRIWELADALKAVDKELKDMSYKNVDEATASLQEMEAASRGALGAVLELESESIRLLSTQVKQIDNINQLMRQYDDLSKKERLSASDKSKLASVVEELKRQYPGLNVLLDEEGKWHIKNTDTLKGYVTAEEATVKAAAEGSKERIETAKREAEARLNILKAQLPAMEAFEKQGTPKASSLLPSSVAGFVDKQAQKAFDDAKKATYDEINQKQAAILEAERAIADITAGKYDQFNPPSTNDPAKEDKGDTGKKGVQKTLSEIQSDQYQASLKYIEFKRTLNQMTEQQELTALERLQERYKKNADIRQDLEVRVYQLKKQMAAADQAREETLQKNKEAAEQKQFQASSEWIEAEERRLKENGATKEEIAQMQLTAWTRVRNRYEKDSEYYKRADKEMYEQRMDLIELEAAAQKKAAEERDKLIDELTDNLVKSLEKQKKAELDALEERRKEIEEYYEDQTDALDEADRAKERNDLLKQIQQYQYATSEKGQKKLNELKEQLRKMDLEDEKRRLSEERDDQLKALDQQKDDIESWYDDIIDVVKGYSGDMRALYQLTEDSRFAAFSTTNQKILSQLQSFMSEYNSIMAGYSDLPSGNSSVTNQMEANAAAWHNASPEEKKKLEAANQQLGSSIGASYNSNTGKWTSKDGTPLFHTGRNTDGSTFRSGDTLMPDELNAIIRQNEYVFTPQQLGTLVGSSGKPQIANNYYGPLIEHSGDVYLEDDVDLKTYHQEQNQIARQLLARGERVD
jgi:hypothetical protein